MEARAAKTFNAWPLAAWVFSALLAWVAVGMLRDGLWQGAGAFLLAVLLCLPPAGAIARRRVWSGFPTWASVALALLFVALGVSLGASQQGARDQARALTDQRALQGATEKRRTEMAREYEDNKDRILTAAQAALDRQDVEGAGRVLARFATVTDPDFRRLYITTRLATLRAEIAGSPPDARLAAAYAEVANLDPTDTEAESFSRVIGERVAKENTAAVAGLATMTTARGRLSQWDGSHRDVVAAIKARMNDPDSFEHVGTQLLRTDGADVIVLTTFRGKNGFGALVLNTYTATVGPDGRILSLTKDS